jgi:hypothetical protein
MSINLGIDVSGISALLQRASALRDGNRAQREANERLSRVEGRSADLGLSGKSAGQKIADSIESKAQKRVAEQRRQQDGLTDRKPIGHRYGGYPVAAAFIHPGDEINYVFQPLKGSSITVSSEWDDSFGDSSAYQGSNYQRNSLESYVSSISFVLPVNGDTFIFVRYSYYKNRSAFIPLTLRGGEDDIWVTYKDNSAPVRYYPSDTDRQYRVTQRDVDWSFRAPPVIAEEGGENFMCVVINGTTARSLNMPSAMKQKLRDLICLELGSYAIAQSTGRVVDAYYQRMSNGDYETRVHSAQTVETYTTYFAYRSTPWKDSKPYFGFENVLSLGLTTPFGNYQQAYQRGTPSIFTWLADPVTNSDISINSPYWDIDTVRSAYGQSAPYIYIDGYAGVGGSNTYTINQDGSAIILFPYTRDKISLLQPSWIVGYELQNLTNPKANPKARKIIAQSIMDEVSSLYSVSSPGGAPTFYPLYCTWDWGKPSYCRQQLLALGFTTADLTP